jgi:hypothetical protein
MSLVPPLAIDWIGPKKFAEPGVAFVHHSG